ncbi:MAG: DNA polymerase I [Ruminococcaceae bacterium]|nr:DNA polymerase I [Oscillospiraceae bacterium]
MNDILVVDGNSIMNRAFYGVRPLTTATGLFTNAVYGYINILKKHIDAIKPKYAAVAFDLHAPTFRHRMYDGYKAGRKPMPDELRMQVPYIKSVTEYLGFNVLSLEGYEADDILGTVSKLPRDDRGHCYLLTGDRDALQLVSDDTTVILASTGKDVICTPEYILSTYGVRPEQLIDVKSLMGDSSDNIPGVRGIGEKGALKLIAEFGSLKALYRDLDNPSIKPAMRQKLVDDRDSANMSYILATIDRKAPLGTELDGLLMKKLDAPNLKKLFCELEFTKLMNQFFPAAEPDGEELCQLTVDELEKKAPFERKEEKDLSRYEAERLFDGKKVYCIIDDGQLLTLCDGEFYRLIGDDVCNLFDSIRFELCLFSYKELCSYVRAREPGHNGTKCKFDAFLAAYLINPSDNIDVRSLLMIYLGISTDDPHIGDSQFMLTCLERLCPVLGTRLCELGLEKLLEVVEIPLAYTLAKMEAVGFCVDSEGLKAYGDNLGERIKELEEQIYLECGEHFNLNSPKQLGNVLFEKMALPAPKKSKTGYSTDAQTLEKLKSRYPVVELILEYRALAKLKSTYADGLAKAIDSRDKRIHTCFNQTQTVTGRLSSLEPNLQNIPVKTPLGKELRRFFVAEGDEWILVDADYSQIELRILAHLSQDEALMDAFCSGDDIHVRTASQIFDVDASMVSDSMRKAAKAVNFGIIYGMGAYSLSEDIHVSLSTAKQYIENYFLTYPKVKSYLEQTVAMAKLNGFVLTEFGRRRYIPELAVTKKNLVNFGERVARNTPIQGTAADIIKLAMINVDGRLEREGLKSRLVLQVHDELIIEAHVSEKDYVKRLLKEEMEAAFSMRVPLIADTAVGKTWYDCH